MILKEYEYRELNSDTQYPDEPKFLLPEGTIVLGYDSYRGWEGDCNMILKVLMPTIKGSKENTNKEEKD